ncbi:MAG: bifunctional anthranilate synthase component II/anthranilate phosphoribosyltransferase [Spirochaetales bacterium]
MILLIDNYDSFTHNLYQYVHEISDEPVKVVRNDMISLDEIERMAPSRIIISPGPGRPEDAGVSVETVRRFAGRIPILGVCLGHQAIAYAYGAPIVGAKRIVHGKSEPMKHDGEGLFRGIPSPSSFMRYHSLVADPDDIPEVLEPTCWSEDGEVMGLRHSEYVVEGVQFHPESIGTQTGRRILGNFLNYRRDAFPVSEKLNSLLAGNDMSREEASRFMEEVTEGYLTGSQIAGFLVAMNAKGIAASEIAGCASVLQAKRVKVNVSKATLDTCGTGGDGLGTFNISSLAALVASACGATVAKHGNRAVSSTSGSADFYRALGMNLELTPKHAERLLEEQNFAFLFAPQYHSAMKHAAAPRRELGIKTVFNLIGPLSNPSAARYQLIGVFDKRFLRPVAEAAKMLGIERAMVVHGEDGLDEISPAAMTHVVRFEDGGELIEETIDPSDFGVMGHTTQDLVTGGTAGEHAAIARALLREEAPEAMHDAVVLNAGAALWVAGVCPNFSAGVNMVRRRLSDGTVRDYVYDLIEASFRVAAS